MLRGLYRDPYFWAINGYFNSKFVGKWLIYVKNEDLKKYWDIIYDAVMNNPLNPLAKQAKTTDKHFDRPESVKPILVYTPDYRDKESVIKMRRRLYELGINFPISYKSDFETTVTKKEFRMYYDEGFKTISKGKGVLGEETFGESLDLGLKFDLDYYNFLNH